MLPNLILVMPTGLTIRDCRVSVSLRGVGIEGERQGYEE